MPARVPVSLGFEVRRGRLLSRVSAFRHSTAIDADGTSQGVENVGLPERMESR